MLLNINMLVIQTFKVYVPTYLKIYKWYFHRDFSYVLPIGYRHNYLIFYSTFKGKNILIKKIA